MYITVYKIVRINIPLKIRTREMIGDSRAFACGYIVISLVQSEICRIRLWRGRKYAHGISERNSGLGKSERTSSLRAGVRYNRRHRIRTSDVLTRDNEQAAARREQIARSENARDFGERLSESDSLR